MKKADSSTSDLLDDENFERNEEMVITREIPETPFVVVGVLSEKHDGRNWFGS